MFPSLDGLSGGDAPSDATTNEAGPIAYVQQSTGGPSPPDASTTLSGAVGAGDTLVVCSAFPNDFGSLSVSDTLGRTYVLLGSVDSLKSGRAVCFVSVGGAGGNDTIIFTTSSSTLVDGASHDIEAYVFEYQNVSAVDQKTTNASATIASGSSYDSGWDGGSIVATSPNELLFAWVEGTSYAHLDPSFTSRTTLNGNNVGDKFLDAAGTFPITGTANNAWTLIAATFK